jgi:ATP-dependent exoDNAse (exonuclease V) beta subunit
MQQMQHVQDVVDNKDKMRSYLEELKTISRQVPLQVEECIKEIKRAIELFDESDLNSTTIKYFYTKKADEIITKGLSTSLLKILNGESVIYKKGGKGKADIENLDARCRSELYPLIEKLHNIVYGEPAKDYITAKAILEKLYSLGILQDVAAQIQNTNQKLGRLPISEINRLIYQIIDGQDAPFIYERIGQYYNHYMIDEFQDTSAMQWQNFKPLITETDSRGNSNLIVGDVKQSIYRFRNSDWHLLNLVSQQFDNVKFGEGMKNNWRTAKVVVDNNEQLMQAYCKWVANEFKNKYGSDFEDQINEISHIYSIDEMHQEARKPYSGYFHMQFFEGK